MLAKAYSGYSSRCFEVGRYLVDATASICARIRVGSTRRPSLDIPAPVRHAASARIRAGNTECEPPCKSAAIHGASYGVTVITMVRTEVVRLRESQTTAVMVCVPNVKAEAGVVKVHPELVYAGLL